MTKMQEYQSWVRSVAWYQHAGENNIPELTYLTLGLAGEAGESADVVKKTVRTHGFPTDQDLNAVLEDAGRRDKLIDELGDVMWYMAGILGVLNLSFEDVIELNRQKLIARLAKDVRGNAAN